MEALGKSLQEQYGFSAAENAETASEEDYLSDGVDAGQDIPDELVVEDLKSSDFENLLTAPVQPALNDESTVVGTAAENSLESASGAESAAGGDTLSGLFDDSADSGALNFGDDAPVDLATENIGDAVQNQPELSVDEQLQAPVAESASVGGGDPALAGLF